MSLCQGRLWCIRDIRNAFGIAGAIVEGFILGAIIGAISGAAAGGVGALPELQLAL